ncbi:MAG: FKBP-type peptidyl-prolyl cis-trans isomerase [Opitutaceae bacterium]|nr:FKBP-type peptidyl-prolyl cis-trans isomerase [Opitutaceae bacterium]
MRSLYVLLGLGAFLAIAAFITRSGVMWRQNPGRPINSAMREALDRQQPQWSAEDEKLLNERFNTARKLPSGLRYIVRAQGTGDASPTIGAEVTARIQGQLFDGTLLEDFFEKGGKATFRLGSGTAIAGWDEAFRTMKRGEKRTLIVPYWLAYGEKGKGKIPPKTTLIFEVELLDWR